MTILTFHTGSRKKVLFLVDSPLCGGRVRGCPLEKELSSKSNSSVTFIEENFNHLV